MSAALRLIRDTGGDDGGLPPLQGWELFMRGAGRADRTVRDGLGTMRMLERHADKTVEQLQAVDVSRFLGRPELGPSHHAPPTSAQSEDSSRGSPRTAAPTSPPGYHGRDPPGAHLGRCRPNGCADCSAYRCTTGRR